MKRILRELRDRHVIKVAIAYLIVAWVILQLADVILPALYLPEWSITLTLALLAAGFPVALILSWIFDITPEGVMRTAPQDVSAADSGLSIAVMPFSDMSADQDQGHFCDGLTEELLTVLTRIPDLRVASRTSCFAFKGKDVDLSRVAQKLRVGNILEGSVRKSGTRLRISAKLIEVATDSAKWSETWDRELDDIFAIQDDIASRILNALKLKLGGDGLPRPATDNVKAYEYFLRGRGYLITNKAEDFDRAIDMFRKAVEIDPGFDRAWSGLAEAAALVTIFFGGGKETQELADMAGQEALRHAPERSGSYMARAFGQLSCQCYDDAEEAFLRALELDPTQVRAYHYLARTAHHQGNHEKSLDYFIQATEKDAEDWVSPNLALASYEKSGDHEASVEMARIGVERIEKHLEDYPDNPRAYYLGAGSLMTLGDKERAVRWAEKALELSPNDPATHYNLACFYARAGETGRALDLLESSIQSRSWIENDGDLDSIRDHPRYQALIDRLEP
jgi:adenylate cyclase